MSRLSSAVHVIHYTDDEHNVVLEKHWGQIKELAYGWILSWERAAAKMLIDRNDWIFVYRLFARHPPHYFTTDAAFTLASEASFD